MGCQRQGRLLRRSLIVGYVVHGVLGHAELLQLRSFYGWHDGGSVVAGYLCLVEIRLVEH